MGSAPSGRAAVHEETPERRLYGFGLLGISAFLLSLMGVLVRLAKTATTLTASQVTFVRFALGTLAIGGYVLKRRHRVHVQNRGWWVARGLFGGYGAYTFFYAITEIGLAKATILNSTYSLWAAALAPIVLKERPSLRLYLAVGVAFWGTYLLIVPPIGWGGVAPPDLVALSGGLSGGLALLCIKRLSATESPAMIYLSFALAGMAVSAPGALQTTLVLSWAAWGIMAAVGVADISSKLLSAYAFRYVSGTEGALWALMTPVLNAIFGVLLFREPFSGRLALGSGLVLLACGYAAWAGRRRGEPPPQGVPG
ncbi:MAG: hypothetical protein KatS3mg115_2070 [Candidatus Poribacteria bacterium]|nr:MAG: hypothetical protein KatS3mg115_2070 [Candidatus Poribacteria bacterium]